MADGKIRVLRLIEYEYDTVEAMERDMSNWTTSRRLGPVRMRSANLLPNWIPDPSQPPENKEDSDVS